MKQGKHLLQTFAVLCVVLVFATCIFFSVAYGAGIYRNVSEVIDEAYSVHTGINYITAKIRSCDKRDAVEIRNIDGTTTLMLYEEIENEDYVTYIYCFEGRLYEFFSTPDVEFSPTDGWPLLDLDSLEIEEIDQGFIRLACSLGADRAEVYVSLRSLRGESL